MHMLEEESRQNQMVSVDRVFVFININVIKKYKCNYCAGSDADNFSARHLTGNIKFYKKILQQLVQPDFASQASRKTLSKHNAFWLKT